MISSCLLHEEQKVAEPDQSDLELTCLISHFPRENTNTDKHSKGFQDHLNSLIDQRCGDV